MATTPKIGFTYLTEGQGNQETTFNDFLNRMDAMASQEVVDRDLTAPPGSPANGAQYIVGASATGDWASADGQLAAYYDGWIFIDPPTGTIRWLVDEGKHVRWTGSAWVDL